MAFKVRFLGGKLLPAMGITAALVLGATACTDATQDTGTVVSTAEARDTGTVVSITDGDTLVASVNGREQTIRLLNIDTPETKDPNGPIECLGQEATNFLGKLVPVGSSITLKYDVERLDKYDRTLAAVYTSADEFVSAEIARAGLGTAVAFGKNTKYLPPVEEAERAAKSKGEGLHDTKVECTLPAQIQAAATALDKAAAAGNHTTAAAAGAAIVASAVPLAAAKTLLAELKAGLKAGKAGTDVVRWAAFTEAELGRVIENLSSSVQKTEASVAALETKRDVLAAAEQKAVEEAAAAEAAAAQAEAYAAAQAQAEAEAYAVALAEAEAERVRNLPPVYVPPAPPVYVPPAPPAGNSGGGYDGYTGPRCYLPGGKSYRPC